MLMCCQVVPAMTSGQHLINDALKMISGCILPSSVITNSGSLSTVYLGSLLTSSSSSTDLCHVSNSREFAATLFPTSSVLKSCFSCRSRSADATAYQPATLTFGAGNY